MTSKTGENRRNKGQFVKGDPRINRKGRPRNFDALRELAQTIAHEKAKKGDDTIVIDGHSATIAEMIMRTWAMSRNPILQRAFIEIAFGKVPQSIEMSGEVGSYQMTKQEWIENQQKRRKDAEETIAEFENNE